MPTYKLTNPPTRYYGRDILFYLKLQDISVPKFARRIKAQQSYIYDVINGNVNIKRKFYKRIKRYYKDFGTIRSL